jgi:hypothetical protein
LNRLTPSGRESARVPFVALLLLMSSTVLAVLPGVSAVAPGGSSPGALPGTVFVSSPPPGAAGPDDITMMSTPGLDGGKPIIWTAYQNGINPDGTPGTPGGPTKSTVAGYDMSTGALIATIQVTGKVDGLTANPALHALIATDDEDANSNFNLVYPATRSVATYTYDPSPEVAGNGGTDSIAIVHGQIYVSHSNPSDTTQPTAYRVTLDVSTLIAKLTPVFYDDSMATDVNTGAQVQMALTDPDTNYKMPPQSPSFAGDLATISQGDGKIIFASHLLHKPRLSLLSLTDNVPGNVPPIDGLAVATSGRGTLYVVDGAAGTITALNTAGWPTGTVFVGEPNDDANPLIGTLNLSTGVITPFGNSFQSPKGILFVPAGGPAST